MKGVAYQWIVYSVKKLKKKRLHMIRCQVYHIQDSVIYMKEPVPISVGVKPVKFCEDNTEEKN